MNKRIMLVVLAVMFGAVTSWAAPGGEASAQPSPARVDGAQDEASEALARLEGLVPSGPAVADKEVIGLMWEVAQNQRLDAAYLLIRCLAFNLNPDASTEAHGLAGMIPAANFLTREFGDRVLPILFAEAITTKEAWLRTRIAFTIREIADSARVAEVSEVFNLGNSQEEGAKALAALLAAKKIDVKLYDPIEEMGKDLIKRLERLDQQHRPQGGSDE
jgi:hypothetical protein